MKNSTIIWFRSDLRLADNQAVIAAIERNGPVIPVFIWAPNEEGLWQLGAASKWWLRRSLLSLDESLRATGSRLLIRMGPTLQALRTLAQETSADAVHWNRRYEPAAVKRDATIKEYLRKDELTVKSFNAGLLHEPWTVQNQTGKPFQVFTPYWKHCLRKELPLRPRPAPKRFPIPATWPCSDSIDDLDLEPKNNWSDGLRATWSPGETGAARNLNRFLRSALGDYDNSRNRPDLSGTSRLSPHLHFGELSPRQVWYGLDRRAAKLGTPVKAWQSSQYLTEIGWREFSHHVLFHHPETPSQNMRTGFEQFPWRRKPTFLRAWQKGLTGFPFVDAGMRELWSTGWMHNRLRMIVASFLVKDLLVPWQEGARWFWDTLVDADLAQNTLGWQWTAGCGADAAPFFRIFNPTTQGEKFDPLGNYIRRWCPELTQLPTKWIHRPHLAPADVLRDAGVSLGDNYPLPIIDHGVARKTALEAYALRSLGDGAGPN